MAILIGDVRQRMGENLCEVIDGVLSRNSDKKRYYILVHSKFDLMSPNTIKQTIALTSVCPDKMYGTMCFFVDNVKGKIKRLWVLPLDVPGALSIEPSHEANPDIMKSLNGVAQDLVY